jgi:hypothetical protein
MAISASLPRAGFAAFDIEIPEALEARALLRREPFSSKGPAPSFSSRVPAPSFRTNQTELQPITSPIAAALPLRPTDQMSLRKHWLAHRGRAANQTRIEQRLFGCWIKLFRPGKGLMRRPRVPGASPNWPKP